LYKNCEEDVRSHIDSIEDASESWKVLQELYEGKSVVEMSAEQHENVLGLGVVITAHGARMAHRWDETEKN
jgi:hypothetical protein